MASVSATRRATPGSGISPAASSWRRTDPTASATSSCVITLRAIRASMRRSTNDSSSRRRTNPRPSAVCVKRLAALELPPEPRVEVVAVAVHAPSTLFERCAQAPDGCLSGRRLGGVVVAGPTRARPRAACSSAAARGKPRPASNPCPTVDDVLGRHAGRAARVSSRSETMRSRQRRHGDAAPILAERDARPGRHVEMSGSGSSSIAASRASRSPARPRRRRRSLLRRRARARVAVVLVELLQRQRSS